MTSFLNDHIPHHSQGPDLAILFGLIVIVLLAVIAFVFVAPII